MMIELEQIKTRIEAAVPVARVEIVRSDSPSGQHSLLVDNESAIAVAKCLRDSAELRLDYASNVTGVDWPDTVVKTKIRKTVLGVKFQKRKTRFTGFRSTMRTRAKIATRSGWTRSTSTPHG